MRFVVGFPPGGPNDLLTRLIAPGIGERLGRNVVVENRAGANGEIAAASVAKAPADGSVFMLASNGSTTVAAALNKSLTYDVRTDFAAVAPVGINPDAAGGAARPAGQERRRAAGDGARASPAS